MGVASLCCMVVVSTSFRLQSGTVVEMHQGSSLTESVGFDSENTSWIVVSNSLASWANLFTLFLANLIPWSSYFQVNLCTSWKNSHSSWALDQPIPCSFLRARWYPESPSVFEPTSLWGWRRLLGLTTILGQRGGVPPQSFAIEPPGKWVDLQPYFYLFPQQNNLGTRVGEQPASAGDSMEIGWMMNSQKGWIHWGRGNQRNLLTTTTLGSSKLHWWRAENTSETSIFTWLWWQKMVTIPTFPYPTPSVTKVAIQMTSPLTFQPLLVINSIPVCPHTKGEARQAKSSPAATLNGEFFDGCPLFLCEQMKKGRVH